MKTLAMIAQPGFGFCAAEKVEGSRRSLPWYAEDQERGMLGMPGEIGPDSNPDVVAVAVQSVAQASKAGTA